MFIKRRIARYVLFAVIGAMPSSAFSQTATRNEEALVDFFERKVRPVLANNCNNCHSANNKAIANLRVDDRNGLLKGGNRGPAVIPGNPDKSLLIQAVRKTHPKVKMPPDHELTEQEIADLATWIKDGAAWPAVRIPASIGRPNPKYEALRKEHWAWQPLREAKVPQVKNSAWARDEIDRFVLAKLEEKKLQPVGDADKLTLIRRVTFDLTGLPPTLDEIDAFLKDASVQAFEKVVDRLLASSAYGERWGRHWLDVARYAESTGSARNLPYPHAWRYRDYVIDAFNRDKPYDRFVREQIAGDLLPAKNQQEPRRPVDRDGLSGAGRQRRQSAIQSPLHNGQHRRADRYRFAIGAGADGKLRSLPRSQIRSDSGCRLLRLGRDLPQQRPLLRLAQPDGRRRPGVL